MDYKITVTDFDTGRPVPGATLTFNDYNGEVVSKLVTNSAGYVVLNDQANSFEIEYGEYIANATGYKSAARFGGMPLEPTEEISIRRDEIKVPGLLIVGAGAALYAAISSKKKKTISGAADYAPYIVPLAMVGGVGVLVYKIGQKFGLFDDAEKKKQQEEAAQRENDYQDSMAQICTVTPTTKPDADWIVITDKLQAAFDYAGYLDSYRDEAVYQLCRVKNDCDVQKLIYYFGHRGLLSPFLIRSGDYTLSKAILERLDRERVDIINNNYARKGIKFSW